ncbi:MULTISPECIES: hypothetical protein [unclassified Mucilaginibacter]|uniref:hypothetical protein n=1 Tax=unclassified Mucilaginibacter TaxID=2617802 RepID=UPI002AC906B8|nr:MULTISPECIES: hypothetical protein [unclassified Mucilaginibacter]MEB0261528.1 hypothetical protein [Mucilaginibacter sp. 10I4]MEB0277835.1 hypothetical protein [Mucilaginibacter sp. 10B2]MEB0300618.1 hypothetical protein [Mucilaginibacter sp. 5C4]WPX22728.1 hypothetical protein RHM67_15710 [Mucilaginibacter sp. 5C4]
MLKELTITSTSNLSMLAFMGNSLTNYQHQIAPNLTVEQLNQGYAHPQVDKMMQNYILPAVLK